MTNNSINTIENALTVAENTFDIVLLNKVTGTTYPQAAVHDANTLGQVLQEYAEDIGVNPNDDKIIFENKRTGRSSSRTSAPERPPATSTRPSRVWPSRRAMCLRSATTPA